MNNRKVYKSAADIGGLLHMLAAGAGTIAAHKGAVSGLTNLVRRSGVGKNYYRNAARAGLDASFSGSDVLPKYRRALGLPAPSLTGLTDYETARELGTEFLHKATELNKGVRPSWNSFGDMQKEVLNNPLYGPLIENLRNQKNLSPVTSNLLGALTESDLPKSKFMEFLKSRGMGPDQQQKALRMGGAIEAGMGALTHGPVGAVAGVLGAAPELLGAGLANRGIMSGLLKFKKGLMGEGAIKGLQNSGGVVDKVKRFGLNLLDPAGAELHDFGHDLGKAVRGVTHNPQGTIKKVSPSTMLQNMATQPVMAPVTRQIHQNATSFVKNKMLAPAKKLFGGFGKYIFTSGYNVPHETAAKVRAGMATAPLPPIDFRPPAPLRAGALPSPPPMRTPPQPMKTPPQPMRTPPQPMRTPPVSMQTMKKVALEFTEATSPSAKVMKFIADSVGAVGGLPAALAIGQEKALNFYKKPDIEKVREQFEHIKDDPRLEGVKVRLGYADPMDDIKTVFAKKDWSLPRKYIGALGSLASAVMTPMRGAHYNPFTNNISVFGDTPEIMAHEIGHAQDFNKSKYSTHKRLLGKAIVDKLLPGQLGTQFTESMANVEAEKNYNGDPRELRRRLWPARTTYLLAGLLSGGKYLPEMPSNLVHLISKKLNISPMTVAKSLSGVGGLATAGILGRGAAEVRNLFDKPKEEKENKPKK